MKEILGHEILKNEALQGGSVADVRLLTLADGTKVVAKRGDLAIEARMLCYLKENSSLPVPAVLHVDSHVLVMEYIENDGMAGREGQLDAARALGALHQISAPAFGFQEDTLIGPYALENQKQVSFARLYGEQRLLSMGRACYDDGKLAGEEFRRLEEVAEHCEEMIDSSLVPGLIHGDAWSGNVLYNRGRLAAFIDPAIYYADPEVDLAMITLFHTFDEPFFLEYQNLRRIDPLFWEVRRWLYELFPLLVHLRLFGTSYLEGVKERLRRLP